MTSLLALEKGLTDEWKPYPGLQKAIDETRAKILASSPGRTKIKATLRAHLTGTGEDK